MHTTRLALGMCLPILTLLTVKLAFMAVSFPSSVPDYGISCQQYMCF